MDTKDILLYESGDGGEMAIISQDLAMSETLYQQVYLALFGGNIEANTRTDAVPSELLYDWWGNSLLFGESPNEQFNSNTERTLDNVALNSSGRLEIIRAVNDDLQYLSELLNLTVDVELPELNKIRIIVKFNAKTNQENKVLQLVYDNAKKEVIIEKII